MHEREQACALMHTHTYMLFYTEIFSQTNKMCEAYKLILLLTR